MWYIHRVTYPKNGVATSPKRTTEKVWRGVIHRIIVYFPPGSAGTTNVRIEHGGHSLAPTNASAWFVGDNIPIDYKEWYDLKRQNNILTFYGYNTSTTYDHDVIFMIGVLPKEVLMPAFSREGILAALRSIMEEKRVGRHHRLA